MSVSSVFSAGWITNPVACRAACADALPRFSLDLVSIVADYLDLHARVYGLKALQDAYGQRALESLVGRPIHELPVPQEVEALLLKNLAEVFCPEICASWAPKQKVAEVFSLYFKPPNISARKSEMLARRCGLQFVDRLQNQIAFRQHADTSDRGACWLLFPDEPIKLSINFPAQQALLPDGCLVAGFGDTTFCLFTKHACTKTHAEPDSRYYRTIDQSNGMRLVVTLNKDRLGVMSVADTLSDPSYCIAPLFKFLVKS